MIKKYFTKLGAKQKFMYIIILIYFILNLILLVIAFSMNLDDLQRLVKIARYIPYMRYVATANIVLFTIILIMFYSELQTVQNKHKKAREEVLKIKSRLYDIKEENGEGGKDKQGE